jgi:hypothetical protein
MTAWAQVTRELVRKNAAVIMACRNVDKAQTAERKCCRVLPDATLDVIGLDLGDLQSVRDCADEVSRRYDRLDIVLCNAGSYKVPFGTTKDGFETHMGVNYFGHFALVGHLMPLIARSPGIRVVTASSTAEKFGRLNLNRPWTEKNYQRYLAYPTASWRSSCSRCHWTSGSRHGDGRDGLERAPGFTRSSLENGAAQASGILAAIPALVYESLSMSLSEEPIRCCVPRPTRRPRAANTSACPAWEIRGPQDHQRPKASHDPVLLAAPWSVSEEATG